VQRATRRSRCRGAPIRPSGRMDKTEARHQVSWQRGRVNPVKIAVCVGPPERDFSKSRERGARALAVPRIMMTESILNTDATSGLGVDGSVPSEHRETSGFPVFLRVPVSQVPPMSP